jgi:hypothetical protein
MMRLDVVGDQLFRADQHVDRQGVVLEQPIAVGDVAAGPDPGDLGRGVEQGVGDLAGDHVGLVAVGQRDQHVGVGDPGLLQYRPDNRHDRETVRRSSRSCRACRRSALASTTVTSLASLARMCATEPPTCPAPRITIFTCRSHSSIARAFLGSMPSARSLR